MLEDASDRSPEREDPGEAADDQRADDERGYQEQHAQSDGADEHEQGDDTRRKGRANDPGNTGDVRTRGGDAPLLHGSW